MSYEAVSFDALVVEQERVQEKHCQDRSLSEYDSYIFPGVFNGEFYSSAGTDFLVEKAGAGHHSLPDLLHAMSENKASGQKVHWVDIGGGKGIAMRQFANLAYAQDYIDMTSVDLLDRQTADLTQEDSSRLERLSPGAAADANKPRLILADAQDVALPEHADLITSVEMIQYLDDPLKAIAHWYNQLTNSGLLVVSAEHEWANEIYYTDASWDSHQQSSPMQALTETLSQANIAFAITNEVDCVAGRQETTPPHFRHLAIQKRAGTELVVHEPVAAIATDSDNCKNTYYQHSDRPLVEVISSKLSLAEAA